MVSVTHESPGATAARLKRVLQRAVLTELPGTYAFEEVPVTATSSAPPMVIASVRDDEVWSHLVPCTDTRRELFTVLRIHFPVDLDNSGFVGWLASQLKQRLGTGVFVICGSNRLRGGLFDYWGCPATLRQNILQEIAALKQDGGPLHGIEMRVIHTDANGTIDANTRFHFDQTGELVTGSYAGGSIRSGCLVGLLNASRLNFKYSQLSAAGELQAGESSGELIRDAGGTLRLVEHFTWTTGVSGRNILEQVS